MPVLLPWQRHQAIGMLQAGMSQSQVARHLNCNQSTISRLLRRFRQTGSTNARPRPGRPRVTTPRQDQYIRTLHLRNRFLTAASTARQIRGLHGWVYISSSVFYSTDVFRTRQVCKCWLFIVSANSFMQERWDDAYGTAIFEPDVHTVARYSHLDTVSNVSCGAEDIWTGLDANGEMFFLRTSPSLMFTWQTEGSVFGGGEANVLLIAVSNNMTDGVVEVCLFGQGWHPLREPSLSFWMDLSMRRHTRIKCSIQLCVHLSGSTAVSCNRTMRGRILPELHNSTFRLIT